MKQVQRLYLFLQKPFFSDYRTLFGLWLLLPVIATLLKLSKHNNFLIFRYVYWHTIEQLPLYVAYDEYWDTNHYGPFFSLVIAPFAMLPVRWGLFFWLIVLSLSLYYAIRKLPFPDRKRIFLYWFCAHELLTALFMSQFNIAIAAIIVATFYCIEKEKDIWAACFIMLGTFVKLYGIVGLAFFFFSKHKVKFLLALLGWALVMFVAPMAISSSDYIISQYVGWWDSLSAKNAENIFSGGQNISLLGMVRKISGCASYSDLWLILGGLIIFGLPYLRIAQYKYKAFRYALLASVLLFVVLFSTGSESSTYIIAFVGVGIWYWSVPWKRSKWDIALMVFAFILTSFSPSDLFPAYLRKEFVQPYALKALPCAIIWFKLSYEMCFRNYIEIGESKIEC
ncbi:Glycosyltransferase family 87 [Bacteroides salyersiae]|jgi:glycoside transferase, family 2|uniref:glycosyltransferase family 87 protein n=1 Tax=Bacteroides salyersiae TaxID=291644 RepID=UPI001B8C882B|nr:glycosyltransferase family 87 protein [Bacteroides salyersiae]QUT74150.1 Glycosyltransferase family 87 [Bacteroides salyersiae]